VSQDPEGIEVKPQGGEAANILIGNLPACNAIIHIVDRVLLPNLASIALLLVVEARSCRWGTWSAVSEGAQTRAKQQQRSAARPGNLALGNAVRTPGWASRTVLWSP
jgi:hypothetical protein